MTNEKVQHYLETKKSQAAINEQCEYGYNACSDFDRQAAAYFRFAINRSASREIERNDLTDEEIEALIAIGDEERAYSLAQNVFLIEERLKCLLIIAQSSKHLTDSMNDEINSQINALADSIDYIHMPDKALELAKLMMPIKTGKALEIIDKIAKITKDQYQIDRLYTAISLSYRYEGNSDESNLNKADIINSKIADNELRQMASVMKSIMKDSTPSQVIETIKELPANSQLYFLRYWIPDHISDENIGDAVEYAVRLVIDSSTFQMPKVTFLRYFCIALPYIPKNQMMHIVSLIDAIISNIKFPTIEYVKLMILVISAVVKFDKESAADRLTNLYLEILDIQDKALLTHCKSLLLRYYEQLGNKKDIENLISTSYTLQKEIENDILEVLSDSAYHLKVVHGPIKELVCVAPSSIDTIVSNINTAERRSRAYQFAADEYVRQVDMENFEWVYFLKLFHQIRYDSSELSKILYLLVSKIIDYPQKTQKLLDDVKKHYSIFCKADQIEYKCFYYASLFTWVSRNYKDSEFASIISKDLRKSWESISIPWLKVLTGYNIVKVLSRISLKKEAREYLDLTVAVRNNLLLSTRSCMTAYANCLDIYAHSLGILIRSNLFENEDIDEFKTLLDYEDDEETTRILWAQIALEFYSVGDRATFESLMNSYVSKSVDKLSIESQKRVLYNIAPALYLNSQNLFYDRIDKFDFQFFNACIENVATYIRTKYPYTEYSTGKRKDNPTALEKKDYDNLLDLIKHSKDEEFIYPTMYWMVNSIERNAGNHLSRELKTMYLDKLENFAKDYFPSKDGIQHDGYRILCLALIKSKRPGSNIDIIALKNEIESIPNKADRAFLYATVAEFLKRVSDKSDFMDLALSTTEGVDNAFDKFNRYSLCFESSSDAISKTKAKAVATKLMNSLKADNNGSYSDYQRILDIIRENDAELADDLLENLDDDPARIQYKERLKLSMQSRKKIEAAKTDFLKIERLTTDEKIRFFDRQMENLVCRKSVVRDINSTEAIIKAIFENPISETHSAVLYFMENLFQRNKSNGKHRGLLREIHKAIKYNLQLVLAIASGTKDKFDRITRILNEKSDDNNSMIYVGQMEKGRQTIIDWYTSHQYDVLQIIDPYFHPEDLAIIKSLMDINNDLKCFILTYNDSKESLSDSFKKGWNQISSDMTGRIEVKSCRYEEEPNKSPWHDRWWIVYNGEEDKYFGIRLASPSTLGSRISEISEMEEDAINSVTKIFTRFFTNMVSKEEGKKLIYEESIIQRNS